MDGDLDALTLADWRRQVAALYADVRRLARDDVPGAWELWRSTRERLYREHPQSPVPASDRRAFRARHWPYDPAFRFEVAVEEDAAAPATAPPTGGLAGITPLALAPVELPNSGSDTLAFRRVGRVTIPFADGERSLGVFWLTGYAGGLFLAFRDTTNGHETYAAGRYLLDSAKSADLGGDPARGTITLDFNFAFQPSCAFDPKWACPLAPPENRLDRPVRAGEKLA